MSRVHAQEALVVAAVVRARRPGTVISGEAKICDSNRRWKTQQVDHVHGSVRSSTAVRDERDDDTNCRSGVGADGRGGNVVADSRVRSSKCFLVALSRHADSCLFHSLVPVLRCGGAIGEGVVVPAALGQWSGDILLADVCVCVFYPRWVLELHSAREATTLPYKQMSLPRTATVVITPNGDGSAIADSSSVVRDLSKAHSLSKARRHKEAEQILRKWVDSTDIGVDLLSSALLIQFYGRFQGSDPSSGSAKELLVTLAELDTQDELWDKVRKTKRLTGREWYYRRGRGTCHAADVASMELRSAEQLDRNDQDVAAIAEFNEKVSAVTRLLELCVSMPASSQEYRKWLFWNYFNHEYDLASGTPVCPPKLEAVTDQLTDLGIADADLINRAAQVLQFCARSGDAVNLLRKQLSFMRIVRSDAKMRELYRKPVLEGIVQLALALLQQGEFQESIAICEQFKTKIASCTDVLVNAYSFSDQYADAVLIMHQREIFKHAQNDTDRFESGQLLADVVNQWKWNVGVRSQAAFAKHKEQKRRLEAGETFESPQNFALEGFASPDSASGGWSALRNDKLATSRCNIEKVHVDSIDPETWRRDYMSYVAGFCVFFFWVEARHFF